MSEETKHKWYLDVLGTHSNELFSTLIYDQQVTTDTLKEIDFDKVDVPEKVTYRGFFAKKDKKKYWIDEEHIEHLPLRVGNLIEELKDGDDVIFRMLNPKPFKIIPDKTMEIRFMVDDFANFKHSNPDQWTLMKLIAFASYISRTYICIATESAFGKSSVFDLIHYITDKSPVFKPRSIPGVLNHINGTGNMVFDETHRCKKEVRDIIEEFALQIAGGKSTYINGALKSANTKQKYSCVIQSITFLFNNVSNYDNPSKDYFEYIFSNNVAVNDRFLKLKFKGVLTENFGKEFDIVGTAKKHRMDYIQFAKMLSWLQEQKLENKYKRRWYTNSNLKYKGRRRMVYFELSWLIDQYCNSQEEYNKFINLLDEAIIAYDEMIATISDIDKGIDEERVHEAFIPDEFKDTGADNRWRK